MILTGIRVGTACPRVTPGSEGVHYAYGPEGHVAVVLLPSPSAEDVAALQAARVQAAAAIVDPLVVLLLRCGELPWWDGLYSSHLPYVDYLAGTSLSSILARQPLETLTVVVVDSTTTLVRAVRTVTMPSRLSASLVSAIRRQIAAPSPRRQLDLAVAAMPPPHVLAASLERGLCHDALT